MTMAEKAGDAPPAEPNQDAGQEVEYGSPEEEFLAKRLESTTQDPPLEGDPDETVEESPPEIEGELEGEESEQDELDDLDLTEEEKEHLEQNPQGRLAKRIKELTRKRKEAEEKLAQVLAAQQQAEDPLAVEETGPNPFAEISSLEEAKKKSAELEEFIEWAESTLEDNDEALADEVIYTEGESEFTKQQIRARLRQLRKERRTHLPNRLKELQKAENWKHEEAHFKNLAKEQLGWMQDEESETFQKYRANAADPVLERIKKAVPEAAARLDFLLAHALNSLEGGTKGKPKAAPAPPQKIQPGKAKPPGMPGGNAAAPAPKTPNRANQMDAAIARALDSGSEEAIIAARALAHS